jgi:hypothetical protein
LGNGNTAKKSVREGEIALEREVSLVIGAMPLFCKLTAGLRGKRTVFYNSANTPPVQGCKLMHFHTTTRTNWHYECATAMLESAICI